MSEKIVLTKQKITQLKKELKKLESTTKKELSETLEQARLRDVSEDTEDVVAIMNELGKVERRINEIQETLENATELNKDRCEVDTVAIGSKVKLESKKGIVTYHIVSEVESDPPKMKISDQSPLGKELLKAKVGETLKIRVGLRRIEYKVLDISC